MPIRQLRGRDRARPSTGQWRAPLRRGRQAGTVRTPAGNGMSTATCRQRPAGRIQERSDADPAAAASSSGVNARTGVEIPSVLTYHAFSHSCHGPAVLWSAQVRLCASVSTPLTMEAVWNPSRIRMFRHSAATSAGPVRPPFMTQPAT